VSTETTLLQPAIAAYASGRKAEARQILRRLVQQDRANQTAWLWLSVAAENDEERKACLAQVSAINPENKAAQRGLERLRGPASASAAMTGAEPVPPPDAQPRKSRFTLGFALKLMASLAIGLVVILLIELFWSAVNDAVSDLGTASSVEEELGTADGWQTFNSTAGGFRVEMPRYPRSSVQKVSTMMGLIDLHLITVDVGDAGYMVGYSDFPESYVSTGNVDAMLDRARDGAAANVNGRVVKETRMRLGRYPGREFWIEGNVEGQTGMGQQRIYLVGNRLYQLVVAGPKDHFPVSDGQRFLSSFALP
jgi:hypothetical protein